MRVSRWRFGGRGIAMPIALLTLAVLAIGFLSTTFLTRNQSRGALRLFQFEAAALLAEAGANDAVNTLSTVRVPQPGMHGPAIGNFYDDLLSKPPGALPKPGYRYQPGPGVEKLRQIMASFPINRNKAEIEVSLFLQDFRPLPVLQNPGGLQVDPAEKTGLLRIEAVATCGDTRKTYNVLRKIRVVRITHPVLSRFSLFVKNPSPMAESNCLQQSEEFLQRVGADRLALREGSSPLANPIFASPIILQNGSAVFDLIPGGEMKFAEVAANAPRTLENGLIFLGGGAWKVGLTEGRRNSPTNERFLLRMNRYLLPAVRDSFLSLAGGGARPMREIAIDQFGINAAFPRGSGEALLRDLHPLRLYPAIDQFEGCFAIRLLGTANRFSPALVLGDVNRYYLKMVMVLFVDSMGYRHIAVPYLTDAEMGGGQASSGAAGGFEGYLKSVFGAFGFGVEGIAGPMRNFFQDSLMSRIQEENFNRSLDFVFTNRESGRVTDKPVPHDGPPVPSSGEGLRKALAEAGRSGFELGGVGSVGGPDPFQGLLGRGVALTDRKGSQKLFLGDLNQVDGFNDLVAKTVMKTQSVADSAFFRPSPQGSRMEVRLPGILHLGQPLTISVPWQVRSGGILIVNGDVEIAAPIGTDPGEAFTICAGGRIMINTPGPIQAALICLRGQLTKGALADGFRIEGPVAAQAMAFKELVKGTAPKEIIYDRRFHEMANPSGGETWFPRRFYLSEEQRVYFSPSQ